MPHPFFNLNAPYERNRAAMQMPMHPNSNGNPFMFLPNDFMPVHNGFNPYNRPGKGFYPMMKNTFTNFQNTNQNSAVDQARYPYEGNIRPRSRGEFANPTHWMSVPPPFRGPTQVAHTPRSRMPLSSTYAHVAQGLHLTHNDGVGFAPSNGYGRARPTVSIDNVRQMSNITRPMCFNQNPAIGSVPQHGQNPPQVVHNRFPFPRHNFPPRNNEHIENRNMNTYASPESNCHGSAATPITSPATLPSMLHTKCHIEVNRIEQKTQLDFQQRLLSENVDDIQMDFQDPLAPHPVEVPQQACGIDCPSQESTDVTNLGFCNPNPNGQSRKKNGWILDLDCTASRADIVEVKHEEQNDCINLREQNDLQYFPRFVETESRIVNNNNGEDDNQYEVNDELFKEKKLTEFCQGSEESETVSNDNTDDLASETVEAEALENYHNDDVENEEEPKKYSKSYWRKQRRLRLKERLMAEKLLMETDPDHKKSEDEKEAIKANKAVKSAGFFLLWFKSKQTLSPEEYSTA
ncbi:hypothetical protein PoB_006032200 [Plakobranchus ocellatus]|uniref:Uncharacterized protein n=1 Tax=Plakobranchus ocellatus TaxID=259542 RepID=A0AAV4CPL3_9GAST|nr:hypothetical protein PoB_006032200 [Plakobranchus ocellatus]